MADDSEAVNPKLIAAVRPRQRCHLVSANCQRRSGIVRYQEVQRDSPEYFDMDPDDREWWVIGAGRTRNSWAKTRSQPINDGLNRS